MSKDSFLNNVSHVGKSTLSKTSLTSTANPVLSNISSPPSTLNIQFNSDCSKQLIPSSS